jgi:hypothetical protein
MKDMEDTVYLMGDDARILLAEGYCEGCLRPAREWVELDKYGNVLVHGDFDPNGNLVGFKCPECAKKAGESSPRPFFFWGA